MAGTYLSGEQTKQRILQESKMLFFKQGFHNTTYSDICSAANINRALIPYHFKNKQILGHEIYQSTLDAFTSSLDSLIDITQFSKDLASVFHIVSYYRLLQNPHFSRFLYQLLQEDNSILFSVESEQEQLTELGNKFTQLDNAALENLAYMQIGIKKEMIQKIYNSNEDNNTDQLALMQLQLIMGYVGYSKKKISELFDAAVSIANLFHFELNNNFDIEITYQ